MSTVARIGRFEHSRNHQPDCFGIDGRPFSDPEPQIVKSPKEIDWLVDGERTPLRPVMQRTSGLDALAKNDLATGQVADRRAVLIDIIPIH